jgi:hypothetical protein
VVNFTLRPLYPFGGGFVDSQSRSGGCREEKSLALVGNGIQDRPFYCLVNIPTPYTHDIKLKFLVLQMFTAASLETAKIATIFLAAGLIVIPPLLRVAFKGKCVLLLHPQGSWVLISEGHVKRSALRIGLLHLWLSE